MTTKTEQSNPKRAYEIAISTWDVYRISIEAESEAAALEEAERIWDEDPDAYRHRDCGQDDFEILSVSDVPA